MASMHGSQYQQEQGQQQYPGEKAGNLSREPSYVRNDENNTGEYSQQNNGMMHGNNNGGQEPALLSRDEPMNYGQGQQQQQQQNDYTLMPQAQGEQEYQGREQAQVIPHEQYAQQVGYQQHPHGLEAGQSMQTGDEITHQSRSMGEPVMQQQQMQQPEQQQGYAGVGAGGYQPEGINENNRDMSHLQPSRSYSTYGQQGGAPVTQQQQAPIIAPIVTDPNATAVGTSFQEQPMSNGEGLENQRMSTLTSGPTTAVRPLNTHGAETANGPASPINGGGLGAALATSGHSLTSRDKKALKAEIKNEGKFEKQLASESKHENEEIGTQLKLSKGSYKNAEKSAKHEAAYRKTYDKAIQREIKAKKFLLKVTNEYNKVAADLESATKEMEIRRNQHIADVQTREADQRKLEDLRQQKGRNDMEREARHGDSLTKQAQAKRALSMSKRKSMI